MFRPYILAIFRESQVSCTCASVAMYATHVERTPWRWPGCMVYRLHRSSKLVTSWRCLAYMAETCRRCVLYIWKWCATSGWWNLCMWVPMFLMVVLVPLNQIRESCIMCMYRDITVSSNYLCSFPVDSVMLCTQAHIPAGFHTACGIVYE
jgi:hypothetical protein